MVLIPTVSQHFLRSAIDYTVTVATTAPSAQTKMLANVLVDPDGGVTVGPVGPEIQTMTYHTV
jgi:hypothetical protein